MASQQSSGLNWLVTYNPIAWAVQSIFKSNIASRLADYFHGLLFKTHSPRAQKFLFTVGVAAITYRSLAFLYRQYSAWKWVPAHLRNRQRVCQSRLKEAYGDCYAVVTGCTEGIGLAFVHEFARMNIGVVLVARNKDKLLKRIEEVRYLHPGFRYEVVIGDLGDPHHIANVAAQLVELSKKVDIGIIVNNAGFVSAKFKNYIQQDIKELKDVMTINFVSVYQINAVMLPVMRARKHRSAILNLSSCTGVMLSQGNGLYSVSKKMLDVYTRTLALENRDKLDVLSVRPFGVSTPMMANKKGKFMITARDCAVSSLADLGVQDTTWTGFMHKVQAAYLEQLNETQIFNIYDQLFAKFK